MLRPEGSGAHLGRSLSPQVHDLLAQRLDPIYAGGHGRAAREAFGEGEIHGGRVQPPRPQPLPRTPREDASKVVDRPAEVGREDCVLLGGYEAPFSLLAQLIPYRAPLDGEPHEDDHEVGEHHTEHEEVGDGPVYRAQEVEGGVQEYSANEPQYGWNELQQPVVHEGYQADPDARQRGERCVPEAAEDSAHQVRLPPELKPVKYILGQSEAEADRCAVHDTVHDASELDEAAPARREVGDEEDDEQREPIGGLLDDGGYEDRREEVRLLFAHNGSEGDLGQGVEDERDGRRHREAPQEDWHHVAQRLAFVDVYGPDKKQVEEALQDPYPDERTVEAHADIPLESNIPT